MVLDEGGAILTDGLRAGGMQLVGRPLALVGTAEKGVQTWRVRVEGEGGHSRWVLILLHSFLDL